MAREGKNDYQKTRIAAGEIPYRTPQRPPRLASSTTRLASSTKGLSIPEKYGIVEIIGYAVFSFCSGIGIMNSPMQFHTILMCWTLLPSMFSA